ncbi:MAG: methyltransferase domain-containing protein [Treponemataceae bacterium]
MKSWSALIVPSLSRGRGTGHLKRSVALVCALRALGKDAFLYLESSTPDDFRVDEIIPLFSIDPSFVLSANPESRDWSLVVMDRFRTSPEEFKRWAALAPLAGIDEGGPRRSSFDYLLDLLPALPSVTPPNECAPELLDAPKRRRAAFSRAHFSENNPLRVLVTFGGEDAAGLSFPAALSLSADSRVSVDLLRGPMSRPTEPTDRVRVLEPVLDLKECLADYDLVITQYGLTAFESARAHVPVLLVSPTRYHEKLARSVGFRSAGIGAKAASRLPRFIDAMADLIERTAAAAPREELASEDPAVTGGALARRIASLSFPTGVHCPLCAVTSAESSKVLARFPSRTYRRCGICGLVFMVRTSPPPIAYAHDYFFDDYKKQYGKTYLEDFPNLERTGRARVRRIAALLGAASSAAERKQPGTPPSDLPRILDIGCAYGPFLAAARSEGFSCFGIDPAESAVRFVRDELNIPAQVGLFPALDPAAAFNIDTFDSLSMWYVIEHFSDLRSALETVSRLVRPGGVFAFSTPSGSGISARVRPNDFFEHSPADHYSIWSPGWTANLLRRYGFRLEKIVVTGHHPERFPGLSRVGKDGILYAKALIASRLFGLGDTFEAYAIKE